MSRDEDPTELNKRRRALEVARLECRPLPASPVSLADMTEADAELLKRRHRRGPPLDSFQRDMVGLLPDKDRSLLSVRPLDSDTQPVMFLKQMSEVHGLVGRSTGHRRLQAVVARHRLLPEFKARLELDLSGSSDEELVVRQQRVNLPAYQAHLLAAHGAVYNNWLNVNKFSQLAQSPRQQKQHDAANHHLFARPILARLLRP